ncbi:hypothetical protein OEZ86_010180 [Tetradesmus obliquus]|nr:hypothetical protein OEZ86_010180 [Tetradesmus obliquus]
MASTKLWSADTAAPWAAVQQGLANAWQAKASERLQELNRWYEDVLPGSIRSRAPDAHITAAELVQLVDWKLNYGKWRPRLLDYAKAATEQQDSATAAAAAAAAPGAAAVKAALDALTVLKGVGPATASAALAAADASGSTPYMGDEALQAACGGRDYTAKAYLQLLDALRAKADWLRQVDPGTGWTAVLVERCLYAAALQEKGGPAAKNAASATAAKAATKPSRGAKASTKAGGKASKVAGAAQPS